MQIYTKYIDVVRFTCIPTNQITHEQQTDVECFLGKAGIFGFEFGANEDLVYAVCHLKETGLKEDEARDIFIKALDRVVVSEKKEYIT